MTVSLRGLRPIQVAVWLLAVLNAENLLNNGGFEEDRSGKPPAGWAMWGAESFKVPDHYLADTNAPRSGLASLRIVHPANTHGLIINDPRVNSIRPKKGYRYTLSFWARGDRPGAGFFRLGSYQEINPFINGPAINLTNNLIDLSTDWKRYTYTLTEGLDFHFESSKYIILMFYAAARREDNRTLWLDDVEVTEAPNGDDAGLINDELLLYEPLPLRVAPGGETSLYASLANRLHAANRRVTGVSFHRVGGSYDLPYDRQTGAYRLTPAQEDGVAQLNLPLTRFYHVGAERFPLEESIDKIVRVLANAGIPQSTTILEFEDCWANTSLLPEEWARGVRYARSRGYEFNLWEIGNETYTKDIGYGKAFPTTDDYLRHVIEVSRAVRAAHPAAQIGLSVAMNTAKDGNYLLKKAAGDYDFICPHYYGNIIGQDFEETVLGENHAQLNRILQVNAVLALYNPGRDVYQYDSEWGLSGNAVDGKGPGENNRNANIFGAVYRAVRLIYYSREKILRGATSWAMFASRKSPGFGVLFTAPDDAKRSMLFWLYYYFNRTVGEEVLDLVGTTPFQPILKSRIPNQSGDLRVPMTPALVTANRDGKKAFLIIANGSWTRTVPCQITLAGFRATAASGVLLFSHDDLDAHPILERTEDFVHALPIGLRSGPSSMATFALPPHSIAFITLDAP